jgi:hypothetical protein
MFRVGAGGNQRKETVAKRTFVIQVFTSIIAAFHFTRATGGGGGATNIDEPGNPYKQQIYVASSPIHV